MSPYITGRRFESLSVIHFWILCLDPLHFSAADHHLALHHSAIAQCITAPHKAIVGRRLAKRTFYPHNHTQTHALLNALTFSYLASSTPLGILHVRLEYTTVCHTLYRKMPHPITPLSHYGFRCSSSLTVLSFPTVVVAVSHDDVNRTFTIASLTAYTHSFPSLSTHLTLLAFLSPYDIPCVRDSGGGRAKCTVVMGDDWSWDT